MGTSDQPGACIPELATHAFFFEEGTAERYEAARYGAFRVAPDGELLLTGSRDRASTRRSAGCEMTLSANRYFFAPTRCLFTISSFHSMPRPGRSGGVSVPSTSG